MSNLVLNDLRWYAIFTVRFQIYACDVVYGFFNISYVNEYQRWTFPKPQAQEICFTQCVDPRNWISIGSGNGWLFVRRQAIPQSHPDL